MKRIHGFFLPDGETSFQDFGRKLWKFGRRDRLAAYEHVKSWRRAIDVGANVGIFARDFASRFEEVVAFEPIPATRECLKRNAPANVMIEPFAVSDEVGVLEMYETPNSGAAFVCNHPQVVRTHDNLDPSKVVAVKARPLDSFKFDAVDLIKLDIQGAEYAALLGARDTILRHRPVILVEEKAASVEKVGVAVHEGWLETIAKTAELLRSYGMTAKEKAQTDRVYVFAN